MSSRRGKPPSRRGLEQRVLQRWRSLRLAPDATIVVGFSGGPDSLALAACLATLQPLLAADVRLVHVDHGLRPTSSTEADRARELAARLGLPCEVLRVDGAALASHAGVGVEESARRERYNCFRHVVAGNDNAIVALGHHQMDQAETVLLHLLRGAGPRGIAGMTDYSEMTIPWWRTSTNTPLSLLRIWRPFLSEPRDVVRDYVQSRGFVPIEDDSNSTVAFRRNAIRHRLLPLLEDLSPGAVAALGRHAVLAAEDDLYIETEAQRLLDSARRGPSSLSVDALACAPRALRRRAILIWLAEVTEVDPTQDRVTRLAQLVERRRSGPAIEIGGGYSATVSNGDLILNRG